MTCPWHLVVSICQSRSLIWRIKCGSIPRKHYINWALLSQLILHHRDNWLSYTNQCIRLEGYIFSLARISTLSVDILEFLLLAAPVFISLCTRGLLRIRIQLFPAIPTWFVPWLFCHGVVLIFPNEEICFKLLHFINSIAMKAVSARHFYPT